MRCRPRRRASMVFPRPPFLWLVLAMAVVSTAATVVVATAESSDTDAVADPRPTAAAAATAYQTIDDDDEGGGGGVLDTVFPFRAIQLYNVVAGYLEYFYETLIAPITGKGFCFFFF